MISCRISCLVDIFFLLYDTSRRKYNLFHLENVNIKTFPRIQQVSKTVALYQTVCFINGDLQFPDKFWIIIIFCDTQSSYNFLLAFQADQY